MLWLILGAGLLVSGVSPYAYARDPREDKAQALAHYMMAVSHDLSGQGDKAYNEYALAAQLDDRGILPHLRLGAYQVRAGRHDESIATLKKVLALDPNNSKAYYLLALVYSAQKKYDLAADSYEQILKLASADAPENLEVHVYLAQLYFSQGRYEKAASLFEKIIKLGPDNVSAYYLLGVCRRELGQRAQAQELFREALMRSPDHDGALNSLAYMYAEDNVRLDDALKMARKAVAIDPANGAYYDTLGWVLFRQGLNAEALMALQKAEMYTDDPLLYDHMGDVYFAVEEFALARKFWNRSLEKDPNQPHVRSKVESLGKAQASR